MRRRMAALALGLTLLAGCSEDAEPERSGTTDPPPETSTDSMSQPSPADPTSEPTAEGPAPFNAGAALADVRRLANGIGPREATSAGFRRAARFVTERFESLGYDVRRTPVPVPAGDSWGVPVDAGTSYNVIATPPGFDPTEPYRIVGAHLDSVAVSPGAEDNGSGISVLLELARMASEQPPGVPVRFIAFGAEEPRGAGDAMHHFGSRQYVRRMPATEGRNLGGMVALDRVGVRAPAVPICTGLLDDGALQDELLRTARRAGVPYRRCHDRASDHWSFAKAGLPAARIGSVPFAGYHSAQDLPHFVDEGEVRRVGRIMWSWLRSP